MKLIRLKLEAAFRSLPEGFEVHFQRAWDPDRDFAFAPFCLVGRNGSGKSNVLEALAAIFYHIECIHLDYRPDGFEYDPQKNPDGFQAEVCDIDAFELEYLFINKELEARETGRSQRCVGHIRIVKVAGERPQFLWLNRAEFEAGARPELFGSEVKQWLPTYILGYSSGHNEILSLPFFKMRFIHFDEYRDKVAKADYYGNPEGRLIYLDDQYSQAILLCHFLFPSEAVLSVFKKKTRLQDIRRFRIIIRRHHYVSITLERIKTMQLSEEERKMRSRTMVELTSKLEGHRDQEGQLRLGLIDKLKACSTTHFVDSYVTEEGDDASDLYLDYLVNDATRQAFQTHFAVSVAGPTPEAAKAASNAASALNLFRALQTLLTLNHYQVKENTKADLYRSGSLYLNETIPMPASDERIMRFKDFEIIKEGVGVRLYGKSLSDGEHQLLHTIGLSLLYRHESALFLLDEPETHLNPDWRASYISTLREALAADGAKEVMREVLLTSHSPFVISDCEKQNVLFFHEKAGKVQCTRPDFQTFGASATLLTAEIFDHIETIGDYANDELKKLENSANEPEENRLEVARKLDRTLGDSIEKTLSLGRILGNRKAS